MYRARLAAYDRVVVTVLIAVTNLIAVTDLICPPAMAQSSWPSPHLVLDVGLTP